MQEGLRLEDCIFCQIAAGTIPAEVVYRDDMVTVFKDIKPRAPVHLLIIPNKHMATLNDADDEDRQLLGQILLVAGRVAADAGVAQRGYRILSNCGRDGGQEVFHLHFHLFGGRPLGQMIKLPAP